MFLHRFLLLLLLLLLLLSLPNEVCGRLIVFTPFLIIIKSPKRSSGDLLFLLRFLLLLLLLWLPNEVCETYCFCSVSYYSLLLLLLFHFPHHFLSPLIRKHHFTRLNEPLHKNSSPYVDLYSLFKIFKMAAISKWPPLIK